LDVARREGYFAAGVADIDGDGSDLLCSGDGFGGEGLDVSAEANHEIIHGITGTVGCGVDLFDGAGQEGLQAGEVELFVWQEGDQVGEGGPAGGGDMFLCRVDPFFGQFVTMGAAGGDPGDGVFTDILGQGLLDPGLEVSL
jgi:hypothetical protein